MWLRPAVPASLWRAWQVHACSQLVQLHQIVLRLWPGHVALRHTSAGGLGMSCWSPMAALSRCTCLIVQVSSACSPLSMETILFAFVVPRILHLLSGCKLGSMSRACSATIRHGHLSLVCSSSCLFGRLLLPHSASWWRSRKAGHILIFLPVAAQALTVLMRPLGAPALEELLSSSSQEGLMARLGQWQRLSSFGNDSLPIWTTLDTQGIASLIEPLQSFKGLGCCKHLIDDEGGDHSLDSGVEEHETLQRDHGLVLLDAAGGEVSVLQQSWTEMMAAKIGGPGVAIRPSKDL